jgi:short-subunit dehydrogenase
MTSATKPLAVVTGASSGIGRALAHEFVENGFDIIIAAEDSTIGATAAELAQGGAWVEAVSADLAEYEGVEELVGRVTATGRPVAALAVNAGIGVGGSFTGDTELKDHLKLVSLNVSSSVHLAKRLVPGMVRRRDGKVLFTSSVAALMPGPFMSTYNASKAFLSSFAAALREELKDSGVTVTALLPGPTDTDFFRRAGMQDTKVGTGDKDDPSEVAKQGFEAMIAGKDSVVAGSVTNKLQGAASRVLPDSVKAAVHRRMSEPGSGES